MVGITAYGVTGRPKTDGVCDRSTSGSHSWAKFEHKEHEECLMCLQTRAITGNAVLINDSVLNPQLNGIELFQLEQLLEQDKKEELI